MSRANPWAARIVRIFSEFQASVDAAEDALLARDWPRLEALLAGQRRLTHELRNALEATDGERPPAFAAEIDRRLAAISAQRDDQMRRLMAFNHLVNERLAVFARARPLRRSVQSGAAPALLDSLR